MAMEQRVAAEDSQELLEALRAVVAELSEGKLAAAQIDPDAHLFDYGYVNSLSAVMFLAHVAERHGVEIEDVELIEEVTTLRAVARRIQAAG
jgi:acyl carrier protein